MQYSTCKTNTFPPVSVQITPQTMIVKHMYDVEMSQTSDLLVLYSLADRILCRVQLLVLDKNDWAPIGKVENL